MSSLQISGWTCAFCHKWVSFGEEHGHGAVTGGHVPLPRADDLRALADDVLVETVDGFIPEGDFAARLAQGYKTLLTSLEAREVELRVLRRSNTVLNERLEIAERERDEAQVAIVGERGRLAEVLRETVARAATVTATAERERDVAQATLASLADVVNQELRESGEFHKQAELGEDLRPFIRLLVDVNRRAAEQRAEQAEAALGEAVTFLEGWDRSFEIARLGIANWPLESADLPRTKVHREVRDVLEAIRSRAPAVERYRLLVALARRVREKMCGLDVADDAYSIELYAMAMSALRAGESEG